MLKSQFVWDRKSNVISTKVLHKKTASKIDIYGVTQQFSTLGCVNLINSARVFNVICQKTRGTSPAVLKRNPVTLGSDPLCDRSADPRRSLWLRDCGRHSIR